MTKMLQKRNDLLVVELAPIIQETPDTVTKGAMRPISKDGLLDLRKVKFHIAIGEPVCRKLDDLHRSKLISLPNDIIMQEYDYYIASFSCTLEPQAHCYFKWARFGMELLAYTDKEKPTEKPIAYDIFPEQIDTETTIKKSFEFRNNLSLDFSIFKDVFEFSQTSSEEYIKYEPQIVSFGYKTQCPTWQFMKTKSKEIDGDKRHLITIIRAPKNSIVKARFFVGAEIYINNFPYRLKKVSSEVDSEYRLA